VEPECIDVDRLLVLELESPLATVLVLGVFPLGPYTLLEEMVVRLEREVGGRSDVILDATLASPVALAAKGNSRRYPRTPQPNRMR